MFRIIDDMEEKPICAISAIVAAILFSGVVTMGGHVLADQCWKRGENPQDQLGWQDCGYVQQHSAITPADSGQCPCGDAPGAGYACNNCNSYTQQPQPYIQTVDCPQDGYPKCGFGYTQPGQAQIEVAFTVKPVGCPSGYEFTFPVRCF